MSETKKGRVREKEMKLCSEHAHLINLDVLNLKILKGGFRK